MYPSTILNTVPKYKRLHAFSRSLIAGTFRKLEDRAEEKKKPSGDSGRQEILGSTCEGEAKPCLSPDPLSDLDEANTSCSTETHSPVCL